MTTMTSIERGPQTEVQSAKPVDSLAPFDQ